MQFLLGWLDWQPAQHLDLHLLAHPGRAARDGGDPAAAARGRHRGVPAGARAGVGWGDAAGAAAAGDGASAAAAAGGSGIREVQAGDGHGDVIERSIHVRYCWSSP